MKPTDRHDQQHAVIGAPEIMTTVQVSAYLQCHPSTIYRLLRDRNIPCFRLGADWRFRKSDIDRWIADKSYRPEPASEG